MLTPTTKETRIIYLITLLSIAMLVGSMRFITVTITTAATGIVRPAAEVTVIRSPASGKVLDIFAVETAHVERGDMLYRIDVGQLREQVVALRAKLQAETATKEDVQLALSSSQRIEPAPRPPFKTALYRQSYISFYQALAEAWVARNKVLVEYNRQKKLFDARVIAASEYENYQFEMEKADNRLKQVLETHRHQWELDRRKIEENIADWAAQLTTLEVEQASRCLRAPVKGTLQQLTPLYPGSFVYANQELAQIAPDTSLVVVVYVKPDNIAELAPGSPVRFQIDAFHHNQWGMAEGRVVAIADDSKQIDNFWVYEVRCSLHKSFLKHSGGQIGYLKKGMTLRAHFPKYGQSVWELVYQTADDRLNPYSFHR